jgi:hypothetical protein
MPIRPVIMQTYGRDKVTWDNVAETLSDIPSSLAAIGIREDSIAICDPIRLHWQVILLSPIGALVMLLNRMLSTNFQGGASRGGEMEYSPAPPQQFAMLISLPHAQYENKLSR